MNSPFALKNVFAMPPPISSASAMSIRWSSTAILSETFAPPEMATNGRFGCSSAAPRKFELLLHQEARDGGQVVRDALGAGVGAVRGAKGVVDVDIAERGKLLREGGIVRLFLRMEAQVFEQQHLARLQRSRLRLDLRPDAVGRQRHRLAEQLAQPLGARAPDCTWGPPCPWAGPGGSSG